MLLLLVAGVGLVGLKAATSGSSGPEEVRHLALGEGGTTHQGNEVTVYGWDEQAASEPGKSELDFRSCRTEADQPLISAGAFSLEMPDGTSLEPEGSNLKVEGHCVTGEILFAGTDGTRPRSAVYDRGPVVLRWSLDRR